MSPPSAAPCLEARRVGVRYGAVTALADVSVEFRPGEVHAVVGENGAGKSTLMRVLAGEERPQVGQVWIDGAQVDLAGPSDARRRGIAIVHQQFQLVGPLSVAENMFLGHAPLRFKLGPLAVPDHGRMRALARERLAPFGLADAVDRPVRSLPVAERQLVEIARAVGESSRILILDEPTASLSATEAERLFTMVRAMCARGTCAILIAHSLEEVLSIADRITVLRNGEHITTMRRDEVDRAALVKLIVGRELAAGVPHHAAARTPGPSLAADALLRDDAGRPVRATIAGGEVLGIPTYVGAMVDDLLARLSGARTSGAGDLKLDGRAIGALGLRDRVRLGICLVPGDAMQEGLVPTLSVAENILLPNAYREQRFGLLTPARSRALALRMIEALDIRPRDPDAPVSKLSGGNRQKVVIAKWLAANARVLVMDDPTKAVDVGAKLDIYRLTNDAAADGAAIAFVSSEIDELVGLADRILVVHQGTLVAEYRDQPFSKSAVLDGIVRSRSARAVH